MRLCSDINRNTKPRISHFFPLWKIPDDTGLLFGDSDLCRILNKRRTGHVDTSLIRPPRKEDGGGDRGARISARRRAIKVNWRPAENAGGGGVPGDRASVKG